MMSDDMLEKQRAWMVRGVLTMGIMSHDTGKELRTETKRLVGVHYYHLWFWRSKLDGLRDCDRCHY